MDAERWQPVVGRWYLAMGVDTTWMTATPHQTKWHQLRLGWQAKSRACYGLMECGREIRLVGAAGKASAEVTTHDRCKICDRTERTPLAS